MVNVNKKSEYSITNLNDKEMGYILNGLNNLLTQKLELAQEMRKSKIEIDKKIAEEHAEEAGKIGVLFNTLAGVNR